MSPKQAGGTSRGCGSWATVGQGLLSSDVSRSVGRLWIFLFFPRMNHSLGKGGGLSFLLGLGRSLWIPNLGSYCLCPPCSLGYRFLLNPYALFWGSLSTKAV